MTTDLRLARVARRVDRAQGVVGLTLQAVDGELPPWKPGAHIDLVLPSGRCRQYSLCGPLNSRDYEIAVLYEPEGKGGSVEVHDALPVGTEVKFREPRNRFPLERASSYLFVAGGIGITPLLPMIEAIDAIGIPWHMVYGGRSLDSMAFLDLLALYEENVDLVPQDRDGLIDVHGIIAEAVSRDPGVAIYTCGPAPLIDAMEAAVDAAGLLPLHFERFVAVHQHVDREVAAHESAFDVQLGVGGPLVPVAKDQSILAAVLDAGADVLFSCEEGTCGSCQTTVLAGEVDHRDGLLTDEERADRQMLICVSRCLRGPLVLDIDAP
ncbi:PDR/VanB family oxidoreductase [Pedococcus sp. NPDC057267]|uniref:PDR/VanB family oxidoreductase n=1 Tax=Pedococcus sp. NPDC057267 TaxID=3346077 RepID=UPI00362F86A4